MGELDDAIREHLELKRRRGADPAEVEREEREALGPVRRDPVGGDAHGAVLDPAVTIEDGPKAEAAAPAEKPAPEAAEVPAAASPEKSKAEAVAAEASEPAGRRESAEREVSTEPTGRDIASPAGRERSEPAAREIPEPTDEKPAASTPREHPHSEAALHPDVPTFVKTDHDHPHYGEPESLRDHESSHDPEPEPREPRSSSVPESKFEHRHEDERGSGPESEHGSGPESEHGSGPESSSSRLKSLETPAVGSDVKETRLKSLETPAPEPASKATPAEPVVEHEDDRPHTEDFEHVRGDLDDYEPDEHHETHVDHAVEQGSADTLLSPDHPAPEAVSEPVEKEDKGSSIFSFLRRGAGGSKKADSSDKAEKKKHQTLSLFDDDDDDFFHDHDDPGFASEPEPHHESAAEHGRPSAARHESSGERRSAAEPKSRTDAAAEPEAGAHHEHDVAHEPEPAAEPEGQRARLRSLESLPPRVSEPRPLRSTPPPADLEFHDDEEYEEAHAPDAHDGPPRLSGRSERRFSDPDSTMEYDVESHFSKEDDVLEETPDFLQDTPDHDRLWFEQRPPRDFDFDN